MARKRKTLLKVYHQLKASYSQAILLIATADEHYQTFAEDAKTVALITGTTLTSFKENRKAKSIATTSFPRYDTDKNIALLTKKGYQVGLCDELASPPPRMDKQH